MAAKNISKVNHVNRVRIISDPLRFESQFSVDFRFLIAVALGFFSQLSSVGSGEYLYRERHWVGATLFGSGWLCGLIGWWIVVPPL